MKNIKIEGISRTSKKLENYTSISKKGTSGHARLIHVSLTDALTMKVRLIP